MGRLLNQLTSPSPVLMQMRLLLFFWNENEQQEEETTPSPLNHSFMYTRSYALDSAHIRTQRRGSVLRGCRARRYTRLVVSPNSSFCLRFRAVLLTTSRHSSTYGRRTMRDDKDAMYQRWHCHVQIVCFSCLLSSRRWSSWTDVLLYFFCNGLLL